MDRGREGEYGEGRAERLFRELLFVRGVPVEIVGHEQNIGSRWDEGMARFHDLKAQEAERTHQLGTIISVLVKADKHADNFQMFFSILQKSSKAFLTAFGKRVKRYLHIQGAAA